MDHETASQRVVGSIPTRRTDFPRSKPCLPAGRVLNRDRSTGLVSGNLAAQLGTAVGVSALLLLAAATDGIDLPLSGTPLAWVAAAGLAAAAALLVAQAEVPAPVRSAVR